MIRYAMWMMVFALMLSGTPISAQDETTNQARDLFEDKIREGVKQIFIDQGLVVADQHCEFFGLDEKKAKQLRVLAKGLAEKHCRKILAEKLRERLDKVFDEMQFLPPTANRFQLNGQVYQVDNPPEENEDEDDETDDSEVTFSLWQPSKLELQIRAVKNRRTTTIRIVESRSREEFAPDLDERWKKVLQLSPEDIARFEEFRAKRKRANVVSVITASFATELILREEQQDLLHEWLDEEGVLEVDLEKSVYVNAISFLKNCQTPDFLSEPQKRAWRVSQLRQRR